MQSSPDGVVSGIVGLYTGIVLGLLIMGPPSAGQSAKTKPWISFAAHDAAGAARLHRPSKSSSAPQRLPIQD